MTNHPPSKNEPVAKPAIESLKFKVDGHFAHYLKAGSGPPVVLLHGGASDSRDWVETVDALSHYYTLYAPDMIGFGLSDKPKSAYYLEDFVEFSQGFIRALGLDSLAIVGHSLGGRTGLELALRYPDMVNRLVLVDTAGFGRLARWGLYIGAFMYWLRRALRMTQPYPRFLKEEGEDRDWMCLEKLPSLKVPTLVVWNSRDPYYPLSPAIEAVKLIPQARIEVFRGYGHAPHVKQRDKFNSLLLEFLNRV